jgi:hypothetical protein
MAMPLVPSAPQSHQVWCRDTLRRAFGSSLPRHQALRHLVSPHSRPRPQPARSCPPRATPLGLLLWRARAAELGLPFPSRNPALFPCPPGNPWLVDDPRLDRDTPSSPRALIDTYTHTTRLARWQAAPGLFGTLASGHSLQGGPPQRCGTRMFGSAGAGRPSPSPLPPNTFGALPGRHHSRAGI